MATPPKFRLSLRPDRTNYYAVTGNNVVTTINPFYIEDPEGWDEIAINNAKNFDLFGLDRDFTVPYRFVGVAAKILRYLDYTTRGSEAVCRLYIEVRDDITWLYTPFTPNPLDLDFSTANDNGQTYSITTKEAGAAARIRANLDTDYKVPISTNAAKQIIAVKPLVAQAEVKWVTETLVANYPSPNTNSDGHITDANDRMLYLVGVKKTFVPTSDGGDYSPVRMGQLSTASTVPLGTPDGQYPTPRALNGFFVQNSQTGYPYMFKPKIPVSNVTVKGSFGVTLKNNTGSTITLNFRVAKIAIPVGGGTPVETILWQGPSHTLTNGQTVQFTENLTPTPFSLSTTEELIIYYSPNGYYPTGGFDITIEPGRYITSTFRYETQVFSFYGLRGSDVFSSLISQATNGLNAGLSNLITQTSAILDSIPNNLFWTSGLSIRSQPLGRTTLGDTFIKISLGDFLRTYKCLYGAGLSIENNAVRIEQFSRYFDKSTLIYDLGDIPDNACNITKSTEHQFHTIKTGYANQTYDEVNGLDEFNTTQTFINSGIRSTRTLDLVSPVRADMWGIFFEWVKYVLEESKDSKSDSDTFIMECKTAPVSSNILGIQYNAYQPLTGSDVVSMSGVIDPTNAFNFTLSPKHILQANGPLIRAGQYPFDTDVLTFQTTDKNAEMQSRRFGANVIEKANVPVSTLGTPLFYPYIFSLNVPSPNNLLSLLDATPYGVFRFTWRGMNLEGFCLQASITPARPEAAELKLLCSPNVNLANLQNIAY